METKLNLKKIQKKIFKCFSAISKEIPTLKSTSTPSPLVLVCNAGLITGCSREDIVRIFENYGALKNVIMLPGKSYCFVHYDQIESAVNCMEAVNGVPLQVENVVKPLYLSYIESIPEHLHHVATFTEELPEGLRIWTDFVTPAEEAELIKIPQWDVESSELKHRKVKHYGYAFLYETNNVDREHPLPDGFPASLDFLLERMREEGIVEYKPDQLTVNQYLPGQGIPPHVDTHSAFEDGIISLSLGSAVIMDFKHPDGRQVPVFLPRRSCLVMSQEARYLWSHGITPRKQDVIDTPSGGLTLHSRGVRTSFTFRKVRWTPCNCQFPKSCDSQFTNSNSLSENTADEIERAHVFQVYENIAQHFSDTRHKPWPQVQEFVQSLPPGAILVDIGCGNGKYLGHNPSIFDIGCDRSRNLLQVCRDRNYQVFQADCRHVPVRDGIADACISIAVIHHLATESRRLQAIQDIHRLLTVGGRALIYIWAKEQQRGDQKSTYLLQQMPKESDDQYSQDSTLLPVHQNRTNFKHSDVLVPWKLNPKTASLKSAAAQETVFHRYYHVFTEGELESLCSKVAGLRLIRSYYDQGNWCVIIQKE